MPKIEIELTPEELVFFYTIITGYVAAEFQKDKTEMSESGELLPKIFHAFGPHLTLEQKARILARYIVGQFGLDKPLEEIEKGLSVLLTNI